MDIVPEDHSVGVFDVMVRTVVGVYFFYVRVFGSAGRPAERGNFDDFILKMEMGQPEPAAYETAVAKKPPDLTGCGVCGYVKVLGGALQEQVADTSPHQESDEASLTESVERAQGIGAYLLSRYTVFLTGNDLRFHGISP
jgi:hypothetical protein